MSNARNNASKILGDVVETSINGGQLSGMRNRIINGDMRIDQRNSGSAVTPSAASYLVDRFAYYANVASKLTFQQVIDAPAGFKYSTKITVATQYAPAVGDTFGFQQAIEGHNVVDLQLGTSTAQSIAISFWVKGSVAGVYSISLSNSAGNRYYIGTVNVTTSWAKQSVLLTGDLAGTWLTDTGIGLALRFDLGTGSTYNGTAGAWGSSVVVRTAGSTTFVNQAAGSTLNITGVQLELGSVATPFEQRPISYELAACLRYYQVINDIMVNGYNVAGGNLYVDVMYPVAMRANPTSVLSGVVNYSNMSGYNINGANGIKVRLAAIITSTGNGLAYSPNILLSAEL